MLESNNKLHGFYGTVSTEWGNKRALALWGQAFTEMTDRHQMSATDARDFLDSKPGRWLGESVIEGKGLAPSWMRSELRDFRLGLSGWEVQHPWLSTLWHSLCVVCGEVLMLEVIRDEDGAGHFPPHGKHVCNCPFCEIKACPEGSPVVGMTPARLTFEQYLEATGSAEAREALFGTAGPGRRVR